MHCNENPIYLFLFWELRGLSPNFHIHVSVSDLYIPRIDPENMYINLSQIYDSLISGKSKMGTRHLNWIVTGPSFAVWGRHFVRKILGKAGKIINDYKCLLSYTVFVILFCS